MRAGTTPLPQRGHYAPNLAPTPISPAEAEARLRKREIKPPSDDPAPNPLVPRLPVSPHKTKRRHKDVDGSSHAVEEATPAALESDVVPSFYPIERHLTQPGLLRRVLQYITYADFLAMLALNRSVRHSLSDVRELCEEVLERYLRTVGYARWEFPQKEPLTLTLKASALALSYLGSD